MKCLAEGYLQRVRRRGLSLLELLLALAVTAMVGMAITGMLGAVSAGVSGRRDVRSVMVLANAAASRLSAYIAPSNCVLANNGADLVLWFNDSRESNTVHATEIRWLIFDSQSGTIDAHYVSLPETWTQTARDLADQEYTTSANWKAVLSEYEANGWIESRTLVDNLHDVFITADEVSPLDARFLSIELAFKADDAVVPIIVSAMLNQHRSPAQ